MATTEMRDEKTEAVAMPVAATAAAMTLAASQRIEPPSLLLGIVSLAAHTVPCGAGRPNMAGRQGAVMPSDGLPPRNARRSGKTDGFLSPSVSARSFCN